jgi:hypothetical protein
VKQLAAETSPLIRKIMRLYPDLTKAQQFFEKNETAYPILFPIKHETLPLIEKRKLMRMKTIEATRLALEKIKKYG